MTTQAPTYFKEQQRLRHPALFALFSVFPSVFVWAVVQQVVFHISLGSHAVSNAVLIVFALGFGVCLPLLLWNSCLITEVRADGVYIRLFPLNRRWTVLRPDEIRGHLPLEDGPLAESGIRHGVIGRAYNANSNKGVLIALEDGRRLLVGSFEPKALDQAITRAERMAAGYRAV